MKKTKMKYCEGLENFLVIFVHRNSHDAYVLYGGSRARIRFLYTIKVSEVVFVLMEVRESVRVSLSG